MFNIKALIVLLAILLVTSAEYLEDTEGVESSKYNGFVYLWVFFLLSTYRCKFWIIQLNNLCSVEKVVPTQ